MTVIDSEAGKLSFLYDAKALIKLEEISDSLVLK